jgi:hypothetical protein
MVDKQGLFFWHMASQHDVFVSYVSAWSAVYTPSSRWPLSDERSFKIIPTQHLVADSVSILL